MADKSEVRDGMRIEWDVEIPMDDGAFVRADIFRPFKEGRYPVVLSYGPYGKGLDFKEGYTAYEILERIIQIPAEYDGQVYELGSRRPGEVGARRLYMHSHDSQALGRSPGLLMCTARVRRRTLQPY